MSRRHPGRARQPGAVQPVKSAVATRRAIVEQELQHSTFYPEAPSATDKQSGEFRPPAQHPGQFLMMVDRYWWHRYHPHNQDQSYENALRRDCCGADGDR